VKARRDDDPIRTISIPFIRRNAAGSPERGEGEKRGDFEIK
jgi:hypothetical protein